MSAIDAVGVLKVAFRYYVEFHNGGDGSGNKTISQLFGEMIVEMGGNLSSVPTDVCVSAMNYVMDKEWLT